MTEKNPRPWPWVWASLAAGLYLAIALYGHFATVYGG